MGVITSNQNMRSRGSRAPRGATRMAGVISASPADPTFDPADATVAAAIAYVTDHPDDRTRVFELEAAGKGRITLLEALADLE